MKRGLLAALAFGLILSLSGAPPRRVMRGAAFAGCSDDEFWNDDISKCLACTICTNQSNTPGCDRCPRECNDGMFWNFDTERCISCQICDKQPNTPRCHVCITQVSVPTVGPTEQAGPRVWVWALISLAALAVPVTAAFAWIKSREYHTSDIAKPVQEIGVREEPEMQNLTSD